MKMTIKQYNICLKEIENYSDKDAYISDIALSSSWGDDGEADVPEERIDFLSELWEAYHRSFKEIAEEVGLSQRKIAERFNIPYRTIENWSAGKSEIALYTKLMMQECLDLLEIEIE